MALRNDLPPLLQQPLNRIPFWLMKVEVVSDVAARDREHVAFRNRKLVTYQKRECVLTNDTGLDVLAEDASRLPHLVAVVNASEVHVVASALVRVAQPAKGLQVVGIIDATP
jgi:hypothetical protein